MRACIVFYLESVSFPFCFGYIPCVCIAKAPAVTECWLQPLLLC
jgi:hypothetical protein